MSYNLTLTDGTPLVTVTDGSADTSTTSLTFIGKNYPGYGVYLNENFIGLLENFSRTTAPTAPLKGQIWWDSGNSILKVYNGTIWKVLGNSTASATAPANPVAGDTWFDTANNQLKVYTGSYWLVVGPFVAPGGPLTEFVANNVNDNALTPHPTGNLLVNSKLVAIASTDSSPFLLQTPINGLTTRNPGLNFTNIVEGSMITSPNFKLGVSNSNVVVATSVSGTFSNTFSISTVTGNVVIGANVNIAGITTVNNLTASSIGTPSLSATQITGTLQTASQPNITSVGTLTGLTVSGDILPSGNLTVNLGSSSNWFNNIYGTAIHAQYADLAERFEADAPMVPGTVVELGGPAEIVAASQDLSENVFGVISTNAAYLMNSRAGTDTTHPPVAVQGRVPVRVIGRIHKGDRLVSAGNGLARAGLRSEINTWNVIGRALENKTDAGEGIIEAAVKLNS